MASFKIAYYADDQRHITLHPDGTIELYSVESDDENRIHLDYTRARILKRMILAEARLQDCQ